MQPLPMRTSTGSAPSTIAVLGDVNVDLVLDVQSLPEAGGDAVARGQLLQLGGSAANTAVVLARLGHPVRLAGRIGSDSNGTLAQATLRDEGICVDHLSIDPVEPTSVNVVAVTPDGERTMYAYRGANARLAPEHLRPDLLSGARALHLSGYALLSDPQRSAARAAVRSAKESATPITLDVPVAGATQARDATWQLLGDLDLLVVGEPELLALTGCSAAEPAMGMIAAETTAVVVVKAGARGGRWYEQADASPVQVDGLDVAVVDTTGAGDAFMAGLVHALAVGLDPLAGLVLANTLGGLAATTRGAGPSLPSPRAVRRVLRSAWNGSAAMAEAARRAEASVRSEDGDRLPEC